MVIKQMTSSGIELIIKGLVGKCFKDEAGLG